MGILPFLIVFTAETECRSATSIRQLQSHHPVSLLSMRAHASQSQRALHSRAIFRTKPCPESFTMSSKVLRGVVSSPLVNIISGHILQLAAPTALTLLSPGGTSRAFIQGPLYLLFILFGICSPRSCRDDLFVIMSQHKHPLKASYLQLRQYPQKLCNGEISFLSFIALIGT